MLEIILFWDIVSLFHIFGTHTGRGAMYTCLLASKVFNKVDIWGNINEIIGPNTTVLATMLISR